MVTKKAKREIITQNRENGLRAEKEAKLRLRLNGLSVERSPKGEDFIVRKKEFLYWGKIQKTMHVEVKYGNSKLSTHQEKLKNKKSNYKVIRYTEDDMIFF